MRPNLSTEAKTEPSVREALPAPVAVIILAHNEEKNLEATLGTLHDFAPEIFIVDSGSSDRTVEIARARGASVVHHAFETHAKQWNWAFRNLAISAEWVLCLDADQYPTPELKKEIRRVVAAPPSSVDGFYLRQRYIFLGRWIKHGGHHAKYHLRLLRLRNASCDEREYVDARFSVKGETATLRGDLAEYNRKDDDLTVWTRKHLTYAARQAAEEFRRRTGQVGGWERTPSPFGTSDLRRLWLKSIWYRFPLYARPFIYFVYRYFLLLGFLDGKEGFIFHSLHSVWYRFMVDTEIDKLQQRARGLPDGTTGSGSVL